MDVRRNPVQHRRRGRPVAKRDRAKQVNNRPNIPSLPAEVLAQIIGYLKASKPVFYENPPKSGPSLANVARVSRLFYEMAMPLLWEEVHLWSLSRITPYTLIKYPETAKRVWPFISTMHLSINDSDGDEELDKTKLNGWRKYASRCLQILVAAKNVKYLDLYIDVFKIDDHSPEFRTQLKAINSLIFRIIRHASTMDLHEFGWHPGRQTTLSHAGTAIIGAKVTNIQLAHLECGDWIDDLPQCRQLTSIELHNSRPEEESDAFNHKFWTTIANLDQCTKVVNSDIPIPSHCNIQFRNIIHLDLSLLFFHQTRLPDWPNTVNAVFNCMPQLEVLTLSSPWRIHLDVLMSTEVWDVNCKKLRDLYLGGYAPRGLLLAIGRRCPDLRVCRFDLHNINDDDLAALSQCRRIHTLYIGYPNPITNGLSYLTNLPRLMELDLHYSLGMRIDTQLLVNFARSCPHLDIIHVADYNSNKRKSSPPGPLDTEDVSDLFAAGAELRAYFEPRHRVASEWTSAGLDKYLIRIDNIRRDKLS